MFMFQSLSISITAYVRRRAASLFTLANVNDDAVRVNIDGSCGLDQEAGTAATRPGLLLRVICVFTVFTNYVIVY